MKSSTPRCPALAQLIHTYKKRQGAVLGVQEVPHQEVNRYGIISPERCADGLIEWRISSRSRPRRMRPPIWRSSAGTCCLRKFSPSCARRQPGKNGEIQLTDALRELVKQVPDVCARSQRQPLRCRRQIGVPHCHCRIRVEKSVPGRRHSRTICGTASGPRQRHVAAEWPPSPCENVP